MKKQEMLDKREGEDKNITARTLDRALAWLVKQGDVGEKQLMNQRGKPKVYWLAHKPLGDSTGVSTKLQHMHAKFGENKHNGGGEITEVYSRQTLSNTNDGGENKSGGVQDDRQTSSGDEQDSEQKNIADAGSVEVEHQPDNITSSHAARSAPSGAARDTLVREQDDVVEEEVRRTSVDDASLTDEEVGRFRELRRLGFESKKAREKVLAERESRWRKVWAELGLDLEEEPA